MCQMFFPTLKAQPYLLTPCLGRERAVQADQFSTVCLHGVCVRSEIYTACAGTNWESFLLEMMPELNLEGPLKAGKLRRGEG